MEDKKNSGLTNVRKIVIDNDLLHFEFINNDSLVEKKTIKGGSKYIIENYLKSEFPTEGEITKALNYLEYELTAEKSLVSNNEHLICNNSIVIDLLKDTGTSTVGRDVIEEVFNKYVDCSTGEPAHLLGIEFSKEKLVSILIIRVVMYYLSFNELTLR